MNYKSFLTLLITSVIASPAQTHASPNSPLLPTDAQLSPSLITTIDNHLPTVPTVSKELIRIATCPPTNPGCMGNTTPSRKPIPPINGANQLSPYAPGYNNARGSNGPSFFADPAGYIAGRAAVGVVQRKVDTTIHKVLSDPNTPQNTVSPNLYSPDSLPPSISPMAPPGQAYSPFNYIPTGPVTPTND